MARQVRRRRIAAKPEPSAETVQSGVVVEPGDRVDPRIYRGIHAGSAQPGPGMPPKSWPGRPRTTKPPRQQGFREEPTSGLEPLTPSLRVKAGVPQLWL